MSFAVYKSSAGSGKTYMLVKEYLKLVLQRPDNFRHTLAITFTNKAAAEMKTRILEALKNISSYGTPEADKQKDTAALIGLIALETGLDEKSILENAQKALKLILHNYSDFAVSTIDSFVMHIVRSFAKDLLLPLNFEVELDSHQLLTQAVDLLISKVGNDKELTHVLVNFIESKADAHKGINIEADLNAIGAYLFKEDSINHLQQLKQLNLSDFSKITQNLISLVKKYESRLVSMAKQGCTIIEEAGIPPKAFYYKEKGIYNYFTRIALLNTESINNKNIAKGIEQDKWTSKEADPHEVESIMQIKEALLKCYENIQTFADTELHYMELYRLMYKNVYPLSVLLEIFNIIEEIKFENNILHISEFNKKIADIVLNEPVPFIYERIGTKYKHYMVDEFQDTSVLQWLNLLPLIENALAEAGFTMIVGDGKQAIYRWRDGEVEQFVNLPEVYAAHKTEFHYEKEAALKKYYKGFVLNKNFRSKEVIVDFNNKFFAFAKNILSDNYNHIYDDVTQEYRDDKSGGYVSLHFLEKEGIKEQTFIETRKIIEKLTNEDAYMPSDIAILCRTNKHANELARQLMENGISVVSSESLLLRNSPVVNFLLSVLVYLDKSDNHIAITHIADFLIKSGKIKAEDLHAYLYKAVKEPSFFKKSLKDNFPDYNFNYLHKLTVYELCEALIRLFKLNDRPNPFLQFFLDAVLSYTLKNRSNIKEFLQWWEENSYKFSVVVPEGENAVRIMSIHKSKGLQFPVVIYPFAKEARLKPTKSNLWVDIEDENFPELDTYLLPVSKELTNTPYGALYAQENQKTQLDMLNLLYVVMTRPEDRLYVITEIPSNASKSVNINTIFKDYLQSSGLWHDNENLYTFGTTENKTTEEKTYAKTDIVYDAFISNPWQNKLVMLHRATHKWDIENPDARFRHGNIIHTAMSYIGTHNDIDNAVNTLLTEGLITHNETEALTEKIRQCLSHEAIKGFYNEGLYYRNEAELIDAAGNIFRPDRIVFLKDLTVIIDYKTGLPDDTHKKQIKNYADLLKDCGYSNINTYLVYVDINKVEKDF